MAISPEAKELLGYEGLPGYLLEEGKGLDFSVHVATFDYCDPDDSSAKYWDESGCGWGNTLERSEDEEEYPALTDVVITIERLDENDDEEEIRTALEFGARTKELTTIFKTPEDSERTYRVHVKRPDIDKVDGPMYVAVTLKLFREVPGASESDVEQVDAECGLTVLVEGETCTTDAELELERREAAAQCGEPPLPI